EQGPRAGGRGDWCWVHAYDLGALGRRQYRARRAPPQAANDGGVRPAIFCKISRLYSASFEVPSGRHRDLAAVSLLEERLSSIVSTPLAPPGPASSRMTRRLNVEPICLLHNSA